MTKQEAAEFLKAVKAAIEPLAKARGLDLWSTRGTFSGVGMRLRLEVRAAGADRFAREAQALREHAYRFGLKSEVVGATLDFGPTRGLGVVVGLRGRGSAREPILVRFTSDEKVYAVNDAAVLVAARIAGFATMQGRFEEAAEPSISGPGLPPKGARTVDDIFRRAAEGGPR